MTSLLHIIRVHWFKLTLVTLVGIFFFKKEFSFQFNIKDRSSSHEEVEKSSGKTVQKNIAQEHELLSFLNFSDLLPSGKSLSASFEEIPQSEKVAFVKRFGKVARDEQAKFNIPASVILAEAMIQSSVGTRALTQSSNNFFAIPCGKYWKGEKIEEGDECFRAYANAWESFRDHSIFLTKSLDVPKKRNYKIWVAAIAEAFGTKEAYKELLISVIEKYDLDMLDKD